MSLGFRAMGCDCRVAVAVPERLSAPAVAALSTGRGEVAACEAVLSRFRPGSDLSRVNSAPGRWVTVDERLAGVVAAALRARALTRGRFDPAVLAPIQAAGYDGDYDTLERRPARCAPGWRPGGAVQVDIARSRVRVARDVGLDLGGIAKGWSAERAAERILRALPGAEGVLVDLGGDLALRGTAPGGADWRIDVVDPRRHSATVTTLTAGRAGIATSGRDRRVLGPEGEGHHLIDPVTGRAAERGPLAVTVIAADAVTAESHATLLAMAGPLEARAHLRRHPEIGAVIVPADGPVRIIRAGARANAREMAA
ncbi:MAG: FAD:protein FMN transferase [Thermoleophilia bacterium]